jgi:hypothetical protein
VITHTGRDLSHDSNGTIGSSHSTFLRASEFVRLATSRRKLLRADEPRLGVRGLVDPQTGVRYLIEIARLQLP